jgi:hypothetical protein
MSSYMNRDIEKLSEFWSDEFVGWPNWSGKPVDKKTAVEVLSKPGKSEADSFKIYPQEITLLDSIAIIHYLIETIQISEDTKENITTYRLTHTWIKQNGSWKILGGMSANISK